MTQTTPTIEVIEAKLSFSDEEMVALQALVGRQVTAVAMAQELLPKLKELGELWHWDDVAAELKTANKAASADLQQGLVEGGTVWDLREARSLTTTARLEADHPVAEGYNQQDESYLHVQAINLEDRRVLLGAYGIEHSLKGYHVTSKIGLIASSDESLQNVQLHFTPDTDEALFIDDHLLPLLAK